MKNGIKVLGFRFMNKSVFLACQIKNGFRDRVMLLRNMRVTPGLGLFLLSVLALIMLGVHGAAVGMYATAAFTIEQADEIKKLVEGVGEKHKATLKQEIENAIKAAGFDKDLGDNLVKQINTNLETLGVKADVIKNLTASVEKIGEELRKVQTNKESVNGKTVEQLIEEKAADIAKLKDAPSNGGGNLIIKLPFGTVNKTQVARAAVSGSTMAMRLQEVGQLPYLGMKMSGLFRHANVDASANGVIRFYDQAAITRAADATSEGSAAPESVISWIERMVKVEKITDSIPVTKESWRQIYFIQSELDRLMNLNLPLKEDQQLWAGTGNTPQITGVYTTATALAFLTTHAAYAGKVSTPNVYDLIATMRVIIMNAKQSKYAPNIVVMNPADILGYKLVKDSFGRYLVPGFVTADGTAIDGCQVIESSQVTVNTLLVGDSRYGTIYDDGGIEIEMGYINDQMVKGAMTIMATKFETLLIRNVDADAFLKSTDIVTDVNYLAIA